MIAILYHILILEYIGDESWIICWLNLYLFNIKSIFNCNINVNLRVCFNTYLSCLVNHVY